MLLARLGTAKAKPNGLFLVPSSNTTQTPASSSASSSAPPLSPTLGFMATVPLRSLPGVGRKLLKKLLSRSAGKVKSTFPGSEHAADKYQEEEEEVGGADDRADNGMATTSSSSSSSSIVSAAAAHLQFCSDLWEVSLSTLTAWLGGPALAKALYAACRGRDERQLQPIAAIAAARKSVGAEVNYGHRYQSDQEGTAMEKAEVFLLDLCEEVLKRLAQVGWLCVYLYRIYYG